MPGSLPVLADFLPSMALIRVDLPTLGMPQISTRRGLSMPLRWGTSDLLATISFCAAWRSDASSAIERVSSRLLKYSSQTAVRSGSARSCLFKIFSLGLPRASCASSGFSLEAGMRASSISTTISTLFRRSAIAFFALFMCPGNHWIAIESALWVGKRAFRLPESGWEKTRDYSKGIGSTKPLR